MSTLALQQTKIIEKELAKMGIYTPKDGNSYLNLRGQVTFYAHLVKMDEMVHFYQQTGDEKLYTAMRNYKLTFEIGNRLWKAVSPEYNLGYREKKFLLYQNVFFENAPLSKNEMLEVIKLFSVWGLKKKLKTIQLTLSFSLTNAHTELKELLRQEEEKVNSDFDLVSADLKKRIQAIFKKNLGRELS